MLKFAWQAGVMPGRRVTHQRGPRAPSKSFSLVDPTHCADEIFLFRGAVMAPVMVDGSWRPQYSLFGGAAHLASGLAGGFSGLAAGLAIGIVGDIGTRALGQQPKLFVGMILIMIFAEALGLYGLIVALILSSQPTGSCPTP